MSAQTSICLTVPLAANSELQTQQGFFQQFGEKAPGQNWGKMIDLTSKLGEINDIECNKGSKIYLKIKLF